MTPRILAGALALALPLIVAASPDPAESAASAAPAADCALPGRTGWTDEGHDTDRKQFLQPLGTKHVLMLFVDFPDAPATGDPGDYYDELAPAADWMRQDSYGRTRLDITPLDRWLHMPQASTSYGFQRGITFEQHEAYVRQAVEAAGPDVDFSRYDLLYVVPTSSASAITFSPTYLYDPAAPGIVAGGTRIKWAVTFGQDRYRWGPKVADHETSHIFGLPDLYAFDGTGTHRHVGGWDLMGLISGPSPQHLGWERWKFGWIDDRQVACLPTAGSRTVRLHAIERPGGTKIAVIRTGETTAYVAESRRAVSGDASACSTGVLVYRVDTAAPTGSGPVRVVNGNPADTPPAGCTPLDMAAFRPGQSFTDPATGVRIDVVRSGSLSDTITLTKSTVTTSG
ncbi:M6 family metalloprotease domain-containing protein [Streptomyces kaniharaensis]|uniref:M6 family metalloprotease domain-containing protein n=1 Tax=Streptomyces kaniharaensis TaxID=212423 RepID=A0A6N7KH47_9ACTN|nr:M6 family metalloprotease domain-containing protein [Streptomyces kaniharaensis]MQS10760.1 M6 family metalloprotease domain-containing protein [Streptomyces kaniharaensis]